MTAAGRYLIGWGEVDALRGSVERSTGGRVRWLAGSGLLQLRIDGHPVLTWPCTDDPGTDVAELWAAWSQRIRQHSRGVTA